MGPILFPVLLPSLLGSVLAAHLLATGFCVPSPFTCRFLGSPTCGSLPTQAQSSPAEGTKEGKNETGLPSSFFLKISAFLLLPDPVLNHEHLQLVDSAYQGNGEKAMAPHSSTFAYKIPWMEPGRLQSTGSRKVRHD